MDIRPISTFISVHKIIYFVSINSACKRLLAETIISAVVVLMNYILDDYC